MNCELALYHSTHCCCYAKIFQRQAVQLGRLRPLTIFCWLYAASKKVVDVHVGRHTKGTVNALHKEH